MAAMAELGIKINGEWHNVTISINDETNEWGKNVNIWEAQTKEEREAKAKKTFVGGGQVVWTDGNITKAEKVSENVSKAPQNATENDLPF